MEVKNEKFAFTKTLIIKLRAVILPLILPNVTRKQTCVTDFFQKLSQMYKYYFKKSCNYIFKILKSCNYIFKINNNIFVSYLCSYFVRTSNTCTKIKYKLYISSVPTEIGGGWGSYSETPYSKFRHISWEQMMTEHEVSLYNVMNITVIILIFFLLQYKLCVIAAMWLWLCTKYFDIKLSY